MSQSPVHSDYSDNPRIVPIHPIARTLIKFNVCADNVDASLLLGGHRVWQRDACHYSICTADTADNGNKMAADRRVAISGCRVDPTRWQSIATMFRGGKDESVEIPQSQPAITQTKCMNTAVLRHRCAHSRTQCEPCNNRSPHVNWPVDTVAVARSFN